jgi:hypothetical protein
MTTVYAMWDQEEWPGRVGWGVPKDPGPALCQPTTLEGLIVTGPVSKRTNSTPASVILCLSDSEILKGSGVIMLLKIVRVLLAFLALGVCSCQVNSREQLGLPGNALLPGSVARTSTDGLPAFPTYSDSVWTQPLPSNPTVSTNSTAWLQYYLCQDCNIFAPEDFDIVSDSPDHGRYFDYHLPYYWATTSDPAITVKCPPSGGSPSCTSVTAADPIFIPANAKYGSYPAPNCIYNTNCPTSFDAHVAIFSPDGSSETDIEGGSGLYGDDYGSSLTVSGGDSIQVNASNGFDERVNSGNGFIGGATASRRLLGAGVILPSELESSINHAIPLASQCINGMIKFPVYPFNVSSPLCPRTGVTQPGLPTGVRLWLDMSDSAIEQEISAEKLDSGTQAIFLALAHYGGFIVDTTGQTPGQGRNGPPMFALSYAMPSPYTWLDRGLSDPYGDLAKALTPRLQPVDDTVKTFYQLNLAKFSATLLINNLKILDPCVTQQNCSPIKKSAPANRRM